VPDLFERKKAELELKVRGLTDEMDRWCKLSEAKGALEKHHSQIRAVASGLRIAAAKLLEEVGALASTPEKLTASASRIEVSVLDLHQVWAFYREKLALRLAEWCRDYLEAADELCWACYRPPRECAQAAGTIAASTLREPPLVFLSVDPSPFVLPRGFKRDDPDALAGMLAAEHRDEALRLLPLPLMGLPWFQLAHLPDAVVLGHEVGHAVEADLKLEDEVQGHVCSAVPKSRRAAWTAWRAEVFADLYAVLCTGPAFVGAMTDFFEAHPTWDPPLGPPWSEHPPNGLRVLLCIEALAHLGHGPAAVGLRAHWAQRWAGQDSKAYEPDAREVAAVVLGGTYSRLGGAKLSSVLNFTRKQQEDAAAAAKAALTKYATVTTDVRCLFAAARLAFEDDPATFARPSPEGEQGAADRLIQAVVRAREQGVRGVPGAPAAPGRGRRRGGERVSAPDTGGTGVPAASAASAARDAEVARALLEALHRWRDERPLRVRKMARAKRGRRRPSRRRPR
jgi:hypothetical protein